MLILVRHAMPVHGPEVPARDWVLSAEGQEAARELCARLPGAARVVASTEAKAIGTVASLGDVVSDTRFDEIARIEAYGGDFRSRRRAYVEGVDLVDWEPREDVVRRFGEGVAAYRSGGPLVIASHGMAMTLWLTATIGLADPGAFWEQLRFPDALAVDLDARTVDRLE